MKTLSRIILASLILSGLMAIRPSKAQAAKYNTFFDSNGDVWVCVDHPVNRPDLDGICSPVIF